MPFFTLFHPVPELHQPPYRRPVYVLVDRDDQRAVHCATMEVLLELFRKQVAVAQGDLRRLDLRGVELTIPDLVEGMDLARPPAVFTTGIVSLVGRPLLAVGGSWHAGGLGILDVLAPVDEC